jgi:hypothetical protein
VTESVTEWQWSPQVILWNLNGDPSKMHVGLRRVDLHFRRRTRRSTESEAVMITNLIRHSVKRSDISETKFEDDRKCLKNASTRNIKSLVTVNLRNILTNKGL